MKKEAQKILSFLTFSEKLKNQLRDNRLSSGRMESVADHSWHLALMVMLIEPHLSNKIDLLKCLKMATIHDLAEAELGDVPFSESHQNPEVKKEKKRQERQEAERIKQMLGNEVGAEIYGLWLELEERTTPEAKLIKALDSLEANYQAILFGDIDWWDNIYYDLVLVKAHKHCLHEDILAELNEAINNQVVEKMKRINLDVEAIQQRARKELDRTQ